LNKVFPVLMLALVFVVGSSVAVAYATLGIDLFGDVFIDGSLTVKDGTEGLGKVFTSDSVGTGSWQDPLPAGIGQTPIGTVLSYAGSTAPTNYMIADGSEISRTTFPELFGIIGTTYGAGDGSTTFNLPELSQKLIRGAFPGVIPGITGGAPTHKHPINGIVAAFTLPADVDLSHQHSVNPPPTFSIGPEGTAAQVADDTPFTPDHFVATQNHVHKVNILPFNSGTATLGGSHEHRFSIPFQFTESGTSLPPFIELVMIIRVQ